MQSEYDYSILQETHGLTVSAEEAISDKGWRVQIEPKQKHLIPFTVTRLDVKPYSKPTVFFFSIFSLCLAGVLGALYLRYYAEPSIKEYLDYPKANCTIISYESVTDSKGRLEDKIIVSYNDSQQTIHNQTIYLTEQDFVAKNWTVGDVFVCLINGRFLEPYETIQDQYDLLRSLFYVGILVPICVMLLFSLPTALRLLVVERNSIICHYSKTVSYIDDQEFVINDWSGIRPDFRQFFYLLLITYYCSGNPSRRRVTFTEPNIFKRSAFTYAMSMIFVFMIGCSPVVLIGIGIYEMRGWAYLGYFSGLILLSVGTAILPLSIYVIHKYFWAQKKSIITNELWIQYSIDRSGTEMKGWIAVR